MDRQPRQLAGVPLENMTPGVRYLVHVNGKPSVYGGWFQRLESELRQPLQIVLRLSGCREKRIPITAVLAIELDAEVETPPADMHGEPAGDGPVNVRIAE